MKEGRLGNPNLPSFWQVGYLLFTNLQYNEFIIKFKQASKRSGAKENKMKNNPTTITITINIATGNRWEGNAELKINLVDEGKLGSFKVADYQPEIARKVAEAIKEYQKKNSIDRTFNGRKVVWDGEGYYRLDGKSNSWMWNRESMVCRVELNGVKVVYLKDSDLS